VDHAVKSDQSVGITIRRCDKGSGVSELLAIALASGGVTALVEDDSSVVLLTLEAFRALLNRRP
jgi:hypothetical protein